MKILTTKGDRHHPSHAHVPLMRIEGKTFEQLFTERQPLYEKYAQSIVTRNSFRNNDARLVAEQILELVRDDES